MVKLIIPICNALNPYPWTNPKENNKLLNLQFNLLLNNQRVMKAYEAHLFWWRTFKFSVQKQEWAI